MLDTVFGVPTHALVVHAAVVLLPLAALGGIAVALVPALRRRYGTLVVLLTAGAVATVPLATRSGERLYARLSAGFGPADSTEAGLMEEHRELAGQLLPWALLLLAGVVLVVVPPLLVRPERDRAVAVPAGAGDGAGDGTGDGVGDGVGGGGAARATAPRPAARPAPGWTRPVALVAAAVTVAAAVLALVLVVRIGHLGSQAAWERLNQPVAGAPSAR